jgi:hypothetical protein
MGVVAVGDVHDRDSSVAGRRKDEIGMLWVRCLRLSSSSLFFFNELDSCGSIGLFDSQRVQPE